MFTGFIEFTGKTKGEDFKFVTHGYGDFLKNQYDLEKSSDNVKAAFDKDNQPVNALGHFLHSIKRGMRTKSWTPLLILTKSEPVLYRAQSS